MIVNNSANMYKMNKNL